VHANVAHLLFNLITFYSFGFPLERAIGSVKFVVLYFSALLVSGIGTCVQHRNDPAYASLGASGAILGVLFAAIVYFPRQSLYILPFPVPIPAAAVRDRIPGLQAGMRPVIAAATSTTMRISSARWRPGVRAGDRSRPIHQRSPLVPVIRYWPGIQSRCRSRQRHSTTRSQNERTTDKT